MAKKVNYVDTLDPSRVKVIDINKDKANYLHPNHPVNIFQASGLKCVKESAFTLLHESPVDCPTKKGWEDARPAFYLNSKTVDYKD